MVDGQWRSIAHRTHSTVRTGTRHIPASPCPPRLSAWHGRGMRIGDILGCKEEGQRDRVRLRLDSDDVLDY